MLFEIFKERFEGCWNNQRQAYSNPRGQALVHVIHELVGDQFLCSYRHRKQRFPYRYFEAKVINNDGHIILKNPTHDLIFRYEHGAFVNRASFVRGGIRYINEAYLGENHYHVKDQDFDQNGKQLWGLEDGQYYQFDRT